MSVQRSSFRFPPEWLASLARLAYRWQWLAVLALSPFLLFPSRERAWLLVVLPVFWFAGVLAERRVLSHTPLGPALALMCAMVAVSVFATYDLAVSLPKIAGVILGLGVYSLFVQLGWSRRGFLILVTVFVAAGAGMALVGLLYTQWMSKLLLLGPFLARLPRGQAELPGAEAGINPNEVAGMLLWVIPVCASLWLISHLQFGRLRLAIGLLPALTLWLCLLATTLLLLGELILVQSRIAYGAVLVAGITCSLAVSRRGRVFLAGLAVVALLSVLFLRNGAGKAIENLFPTEPVPTSLTSLASLRQRVEVWSRALEAIQDFTVIGMGMNTFRKVVHLLYPLTLTGPDFDIAHAHNEFLQAALDLGIPGLIAFIAIYINAYWMLVTTWKSVPIGGSEQSGHGSVVALLDTPLAIRALALGLGTGLFAHVLYGLADAVALGAKPGVLFWMLIGLSTALYQRTHERMRTQSAVEMCGGLMPSGSAGQ